MEYSRNINGMLALGYGSKYQLLRMLGWHRDDFNKKVNEALDLEGGIHWFDFKYDGYCDKELLNLEFITKELDDEWKKYWMCGNGGINWDAVGISQDGTYILVEAKAHLSEMKNSASGSQKSQEHNLEKIEEFINRNNISSSADVWSKDVYQLANRLIITDFLKNKGFKVKLLYVLFENGFEYNRDKSDSATKDEWNTEMERELISMGIKGTNAEALVNWCIINCNYQ